MAEMLGECRLCREMRPLRDSHLMPRALYRYWPFLVLTSTSQSRKASTDERVGRLPPICCAVSAKNASTAAGSAGCCGTGTVVINDFGFDNC